MLLLLVLLANQAPLTIVRCTVDGDPQARTYELQRLGEGASARWRVAMRSREAGAAPVFLPLPDAKPSTSAETLSLEYRTLNGGREVRWMVESGRATLDVRANFELEVNVEADLDPRVELMNTDGVLTTLSCTMRPPP